MILQRAYVRQKMRWVERNLKWHKLRGTSHNGTLRQDVIILNRKCKLVSAVPVSYTHLDVYKRQEYNI